MPSALVALLVSHLKSALDFVAKRSSVDGTSLCCFSPGQSGSNRRGVVNICSRIGTMIPVRALRVAGCLCSKSTLVLNRYCSEPLLKILFQQHRSRAAVATTLGSRPVYPRQLPTCCIAKVGRVGPGADVSRAIHQQNRERGFDFVCYPRGW